jgi:hypothetical protein
MTTIRPFPHVSPALDLRVGDAERDAVADRLAAHAAAGRLDVAELERRLDAVHADIVRRDLIAVEADLPVADPPARARLSPPAILVPVGAALTIAASVAAGHPLVPPLFAALVLWRAARRPDRLHAGAPRPSPALIAGPGRSAASNRQEGIR